MATSSRKKPTSGGASTRKKAAKGKAAKRPARRRTAGKRGASTDAGRSAPAQAEVDAEVLEFIAAIERFKQENGRPFPSWSEVLMVLRELGYRRS